jgi:hypothetical protein
VHRGLAEAEERHDGDGEEAYGRRVGSHEAGGCGAGSGLLGADE